MVVLITDAAVSHEHDGRISVDVVCQSWGLANMEQGPPCISTKAPACLIARMSILL